MKQKKSRLEIIARNISQKDVNLNNMKSKVSFWGNENSERRHLVWEVKQNTKLISDWSDL